MRITKATGAWKGIALGIVGILFLSTARTEAAFTWEAHNDAFSGSNVIALTIDGAATSTIYALTEQRGVYKSTDGGGTWAEANTGLPAAKTVYGGFGGNMLIQDPAHAGTLYANINGVIYKTTDGAASWTSANTGIPTCNTYGVSVGVVIDPYDPTHLLDRRLMSGCAHALYESHDTGATWSVIETAGTLANDAVDVVYDSAVSSTLYMATIYIGYLRSDDGGVTWATKSPSGTASQGYAVAVHPDVSRRVIYGDGAGLFVSEDGGDTWSQIANATGTINQIAFASSDHATAYAVGKNGLWKSTDGGFTWTRKGSYENQGLHGIAIDPTDSNTLYLASTLTGISKSTDGGSSRSAINTGIPVDIAVTSLAFASSSSDTVYAAVSGNGFYKSTDRGYTWTLQSSAYPDVNTSYYILVDPNDENTIYAGFEKVMKSTDGGVTFTDSLNPPGDQFFQAAAIDPADASHVIIAEGSTAHETRDGGATWNAITTLTPAGYIMRIRFDTADTQKVYAATYDYFWKSADNGATWTQETTGLGGAYANWGDDLAIDPDDHQVIYIGARDDGVYRSTDGGVTWNATGYRSDTPGDTPSRVIATTNTLYAFSTHGFKKSINNGTSWTTLSEAGLTSSFYTPKWPAIIDPQDELRILSGDSYQGLIIFGDTEPVFSSSSYSAIDDNGGSLEIGDTITISGFLSNTGITDVTNATIRSVLPANVGYIPGSATIDGAVVSSPITGSTLSIPIGTLARNATSSLFSYQLQALKGGVFTISATASSTESTAATTLGSQSFTGVPTIALETNTASLSEGATTTLRVILNASSTDTTTAHYATTDGTAIAGTDYTTASGTLTFTPGATSGTIALSATTDTSLESDETFSVTLSNPSGATLGAITTSTVTILNVPVIIMETSSVSVSEGDTATIRVIANSTSSNPMTVHYATTQGTATAGTDYTTASGTLTIAAGQTSGTITIATIEDSDVESDETLLITLATPSGAFLGSSTTSTVTITNDDTAPAPTVSPNSGGGGGGGGGWYSPPPTIASTTTDLYALITSLLAQVAELQRKLRIAQGEPSTSFTRTLREGMEGDDVRELQKYLNLHGYLVAKTGDGSLGKETGYFGRGTKSALIRFQESHEKEILTPAGLTKGSGIFAGNTRKFIEANP